GAIQILEHHVGRAGLKHTDIEHARHVLAPQPDRSLRFAQEPLHDLRATQHLGQQELHRHRLTEVEVSRLHHDAHAALADDPFDAISPCEDGAELDTTAIHHRITRGTPPATAAMTALQTTTKQLMCAPSSVPQPCPACVQY